MMALVPAVASIASLAQLPALAVLAGLTFGAHWSLASAIVSDLWGLRNFASNYTALQMAPAMGSYVLATLLVGWLYDREAERQSGAAHNECIGQQCFRRAFEVLAVLGLTGVCSAALLVARSRRAYAAVVERLRREVAAAGEANVLQE